jgi:broad specificity phosphatase PhoE
MQQNPELWLVRHGETEWSIIGAHTGKTDVLLTERGVHQAAIIGARLEGKQFTRVLASPRVRARETCRLAGFGEIAEIDQALQEWDYGAYEGKSTSEIRTTVPDWSLWKDGVPGGETLNEVAVRALKVIQECLRSGGPVLLFSHAHFLRVLTACWLGLVPHAGSLFALDVASVSVLGLERGCPVIQRWNECCGNRRTAFRTRESSRGLNRKIDTRESLKLGSCE